MLCIVLHAESIGPMDMKSLETPKLDLIPVDCLPWTLHSAVLASGPRDPPEDTPLQLLLMWRCLLVCRCALSKLDVY